MTSRKIILASASPRRIEMIRSKGIKPIIISTYVNEAIPKNMAHHSAAMFLALKKALRAESIALSKGYNNHIVIAADTLVVVNNRVLGKPIEPNEVYEFLSLLNGNEHTVITGVCILGTGTTEREVFYEKTKVFFKKYSHEEILKYTRTTEPYDKAGAYGIQGTWGKYIDRIEGSYDNVIGFPWDEIAEKLRKY